MSAHEDGCEDTDPMNRCSCDTKPTIRELLKQIMPFDLDGDQDPGSDPVAAMLIERVEALLSKCDELSALDKRSGFKGDGHISIALVRRVLNGEQP